MTAAPTVLPIGDNPTPLWGMTSRERLRRIAAARGLAMTNSVGAGPCLRVDLGYAFDPLWLAHAAATPGLTVRKDGVAVIVHQPASGDPIPPYAIDQETSEIENKALRKRERPFMARLTPASVPALERASYAGATRASPTSSPSISGRNGPSTSRGSPRAGGSRPTW